MVKRFVVATENYTQADDKKLLDFLQFKGWWHRSPQFWLIVDYDDTLTSVTLRDFLMTSIPNKNVFVSEVMPLSWAAAAPSSEHAAMSDWLNPYWIAR